MWENKENPWGKTTINNNNTGTNKTQNIIKTSEIVKQSN